VKYLETLVAILGEASGVHDIRITWRGRGKKIRED
jgi:hypothetical protein